MYAEVPIEADEIVVDAVVLAGTLVELKVLDPGAVVLLLVSEPVELKPTTYSHLGPATQYWFYEVC